MKLVSTSNIPLPTWLEVGVIPILNVLMALFVSGLIMLAIGVDPIEALGIMINGAFGYDEAVGYTLYYTTNFIFTGLAVAIAFHARLFNIGGEGQAYIGGLGVGLFFLAFDGTLPAFVLLPMGIVCAGLAGAAWAFIPGWLQAHRGSHIVITTIMFNFIAASLMVYLLVNVLIEPGQMSPESRTFDQSAWLPFMHEFLAGFNIEITRSPLNLLAVSRTGLLHVRLGLCMAYSVGLRTANGRAERARSRVRGHSAEEGHRLGDVPVRLRWQASSRSTRSWVCSTSCC